MRKNVSGQIVGATMVSATDGSAFTGSVTVSVTGDGGTQATGSVGAGACTNEGNSYYTYAPAQAETNYDQVAFTFTGTGAIPVTVMVYPAFPQTGDSFTRIGAAGAGLTGVPWNASWDAEVQSELQDAIVANNLDHLAAAPVAGTDVVDDSIFAKLVSSAATADWDSYVNTTDALQALRDRGDAAWVTGGGGSISDIVQWQVLVPSAVDLANTKVYRLAIALTNQLDDLPTTLEITPGTISIDRAAQGGTTWTSVVANAACSESAGLIYYDEVFDTATGYESGDMLRVTFKGQLVTVSANDYEITDGTNGIICYTGIVADTPDVNVAQIGGSTANIARLNSFLAALSASGLIQAGTIAADAFTAGKFQDGFLTSGKLSAGAITAIQAGLATAVALTDVDTVVDAIKLITDALPEGGALTTLLANVAATLEDTGTTLPATLATIGNNVTTVDTVVDAVKAKTDSLTFTQAGQVDANMQSINDVLVTGNGGPGTEFGV